MKYYRLWVIKFPSNPLTGLLATVHMAMESHRSDQYPLNLNTAHTIFGDKRLYANTFLANFLDLSYCF